jgi:hypothetical protein
MVTITCGKVVHNQHRQECLCYGLVLAATSATTAIGWTASAAASSATWPASAAATALAHWPGFVHYQRTAQKILAIAGLNGAVRFFVVSKFREAKSSRLTGELIANDLD